MCATILGHVLGNCVGAGDQKDFSVGVGGRKDFSGECEGSGNEVPGGAIGGFGGIGAESKFQDGGKELIIEEEGDSNFGLKAGLTNRRIAGSCRGIVG